MEGDETMSHGKSDSDFGDFMWRLFSGVDGDHTAAYGEEGDVFAQNIMGYAGLTNKEGHMGIELSKEAQTQQRPHRRRCITKRWRRSRRLMQSCCN